MRLDEFLKTVGADKSGISNISKEEAMAAVQKNGFALQHVADLNKTPEVCIAAVQKNGLALQHVADSNKTPEVCMAAVTENRNAIMYVQACAFDS